MSSRSKFAASLGVALSMMFVISPGAATAQDVEAVPIVEFSAHGSDEADAGLGVSTDCPIEDMCCICSWQFEDRPYTNARGYFHTQEFFGEIHKVCWSELIDVLCTSREGLASVERGPLPVSPALDRALEIATEENKLVFFLGLTGG